MTANLFEKLKIQVCNNIKQYRHKAGYPKESPSNEQILNLIYPKIQPPYDGIKYSIELSAGEIKELLNILEDYPALKSERDSLWKAQNDMLKKWNESIKILKDSRLTPAKRNREVLHIFELIVKGVKRCKFNKRRIKHEFEQLVEGYYCPNKQQHIAPISMDKAIEFLTHKHKFASINACNQNLKSAGVKGLPNTWEKGSIPE